MTSSRSSTPPPSEPPISEAERYLRTDFLARLAHEVRSPLGVLSGALEEALPAGPNAPESSSEEQKLLISIAERGLRRIARLAENLSLVSQLELGCLEYAKMRVDLGQEVRFAVHSAQAIESRRGVEIRLQLPEEPCWVLVDSRRVRTALTELVLNALRYASRQVNIQLHAEGDEAVVSIEDDGQGIPTQEAELLFRRFSPRSGRSGLGIGLSIAHDLIQAQQGRLLLDQDRMASAGKADPGTRFWVRFPQAAGSPS